MSRIIFEKSNYKIIEADGDELLIPVAQKLLALSQEQEAKHISLFGGSTVFKLFAYLEKSGLSEQINWNNLHLWWNDERLVEHTSSESNYGELNRKYLSKLNINAENTHPIKGFTQDKLEYSYVEAEVNRMIDLVRELIPANSQGIPSFDLIVLGIGDDGHTASLFPAVFDLETTDWYIPAFHPLTSQPRISQSLELINAAKEICFIASGAGKAHILGQTISAVAGVLLLQDLIRQQHQDYNIYQVVKEKFGNEYVLVYVGLNSKTTMYLDSEAAKEIDVNTLTELSNNLAK